MISSKSSNPASATEKTRAHRVFKRKQTNAQMPSNPRPPRMISVTHFKLTRKNSYKCAYHFLHSTLTITQIPKTINELTLRNMPCFPHFHGPHIIISVNRYHSHYITTQATMNCVTLDYIT